MDDTSLRTPVLDVHRYSGFRPLRTIWAVSCITSFLVCILWTIRSKFVYCSYDLYQSLLVYSILQLFIEIITLAYVFILTKSHVRCDLYYMIMYAEASIWFIFSIVRMYISWQHKMFLIGRGYFEVYQHFSKFIELSFYICSIWLGLMLIITCLYVQYAPRSEFFCETEYYYSPIVVVTILLTVQNFLLLPLFILYINEVQKFNKGQVPPDSENGNQYMPSALRSHMDSDEIGVRPGGETVDSMLEKQADLIRYYKEANEMLNKKLFDLTSQGRGIIDPAV